MTTQDHAVQKTESKEEQAEKLRRVLSVKDPAQAQAKPSEAQPKPAPR